MSTVASKVGMIEYIKNPRPQALQDQHKPPKADSVYVQVHSIDGWFQALRPARL
jgi:hypothetical protein